MVALTFESSELGSVALTSGLGMPTFSCRGIYCGLKKRDLARMRVKFHIPNTFSLSISAEHFWAYIFQPSFVFFYEDAFLVGACISL